MAGWPWSLNNAFIPPLLSIQASRWLTDQLEQLLSQLRIRLQRLMAMRRESNERMADFAVADVSLFWLLNAVTHFPPAKPPAHWTLWFLFGLQTVAAVFMLVRQCQHYRQLVTFR